MFFLYPILYIYRYFFKKNKVNIQSFKIEEQAIFERLCILYKT